MPLAHRTARRRAAVVLVIALASLGACRSAGSIGDVLGSVLGGGGQGNQLAGTIAGVDTRGQQIGIQQGNGQTVGVGYDNNTRVVFQNQNYPVTALEQGDQVVARVIDRGNGAYYTDSVHVTQSVSATSSTGGAAGSGGESVRSFEGVVRQIDRNAGAFSMDMRSGGTVVVSLPYAAQQADVNRFRSLQAGDAVRLTGTYINNTRIELQRFY